MSTIEQPFDVFAEDVRFEVDQRARLEFVEVGFGVGVGDDGDLEPLAARIALGDREANAVNGDAALGNDIAGNAGGSFIAIASQRKPHFPGILI